MAQFPPPTHGVAVMNQLIADSKSVNAHLNLQRFQLNREKPLNELGTFSIANLRFALQLFIHLRRRIRDVDAVYFNFSPYGFAFLRDLLFLFAIRKRISANQIYLHFHGQGFRSLSGWKLKWTRRLFTDTNMIILSPTLRQDIETVEVGLVHVLPNGLSSSFQLNNGIVDQRFNSRRLLYLSHLKKSKGIDTFLDILEALKQSGVPFQADIVGGDTTEMTVDDLRRITARRGLMNEVTIHGLQLAEMKDTILNQSSVLVYPTRFDAFPLVILEALSAGLPVVASREGGIPDIIRENENGHMVDPDNIDAFATHIANLLSDKQLYSTVSGNAFDDFQQRYAFEVFETRFINIFAAESSKTSPENAK